MHKGLALVFLPLLALANLPKATSPSPISLVPIGPIPLLVGDVVYVFFSPPLGNVLASCTSSNGGAYRQVISMNESLTNVPVQLGGDQGSYVQLVPQSEGSFNMVLNVSSQQPFNMLLGILTRDTTNFELYMIHVVERAYFVEILTMQGLAAENWSISFVFDVTTTLEESWLSIPLPSSAGALFLIAAIVGLSYPNAYLFTDLYYRSKKEEVSKKRKVGIGVLVILSLIIIYWIYVRVI